MNETGWYREYTQYAFIVAPFKHMVNIDRGRCSFVALVYKHKVAISTCTESQYVEFYETVRDLMLAGY